jgi:hypothetical protein
MKKSRMTWLAAVAFVLANPSVVMSQTLPGTASTPNSVGGITPYIIPGANDGGNRTCKEVGLAFFGDENYYQFSSDRVEHPFGSYPEPGITVTVTEGKFVAFSSTFAIGAAIVKGGTAANVYVYDPQRTSDSGLASPINDGNQQAGLSNLTFCWNPTTTASQWCSPGYWRQEHHYDSWALTGYTKETLFRDVLGFYPTRSRKGVTDGATTNPTLWQVLQSPQWYGGDAFNLVGDELSEAHPDVAFTGERADGTCPLN